MPIRQDLMGVADLVGLERQQCSARSKSRGTQCQHRAVPGASVCWNHGGAAPQVQEAALRRILDTLVPQGVQVMRDLLEDEDAPMSLRLRAAIDVLDRAGVKTQAEPVRHEATVSVNVQLDRAIEAVLARRLPEITGGTVDAEVVEEGPALSPRSGGAAPTT